jgi:uncharacterized protein (TIGR00255 family)
MRSMTGFGQASFKRGDLQVAAEARSLNQRFFELKLNLPRGWGEHEAEVRKLVQRIVARGRVEVIIRLIGFRAARSRVRVNEELAKSYVMALRRLGKDLRLSGAPGIDALLERPEIFQIVEEEVDHRADVNVGLKVLMKALRALDSERTREGRSLQRDLRSHLAKIDSSIPKIANLAEESRREIMTAFEARMRELLADAPINEKRLHEEAAAAAQRADISEELARLRAHLEALRGLLGENRPVGKEIEFLLQEVNREVNTIGAKSQNARLSRVAVEVKGALEKMREQVQNVE